MGAWTWSLVDTLPLADADANTGSVPGDHWSLGLDESDAHAATMGTEALPEEQGSWGLAEPHAALEAMISAPEALDESGLTLSAVSATNHSWGNLVGSTLSGEHWSMDLSELGCSNHPDSACPSLGVGGCGM
jgi:hypothetical protein